jgi:hypothetical protein
MDTLFEMPEARNGSGKSNEWYTNSRYIEAARTVMGGIDLDPASTELANQTVKATRYYSIEDDGLKHDWHGRVWLNPPFGRKDAAANGFGGGKTIMGIFIKKLIEEYRSGHVTQAILLATAKTDASWFFSLWGYPVCIANHRVIFTRPGMEPQGHFYGTIFVYLGADETKFIDIFSQFGPIVKQVSRPPAKPRTLDLWNDATTLANEIAAWEVPGGHDENEQVG